MRFCRFEDPAALADGARYGLIEGDQVRALEGAPWEGARSTAWVRPLKELRLLPPSPASKIVCIGQNYRKHAEEMGKPVPAQPLIFIKPSTALNSPQAPIQLPAESQDVQYEAELAVIVGRRLKGASEAEAAAAIAGLTCFNDVTARDIQRQEVQHTRAKGFDTFACLGPWAETDLSWKDLAVRCRVNGELRQDGRTSDMVFSPPALLAFISRGMTLLPGDVVSTGTPSGVGRLSAGDVVEVEIEGIGVLRNPVL